MVLINGGSFEMGGDTDLFTDTSPVHTVTISSFWMDKTLVTNAEFAAFVAATGYKTTAEQPLNPADFPGVPPEKLKLGSVVFTPPKAKVSLDDVTQWWSYIQGASWRYPEGPGSSIDYRMDHPVVHVSHDDAIAYAKWAGKQLPTEAQREFAARGGLKQKPYVWGDMAPSDAAKPLANLFDGSFPYKNTLRDGYARTSPVQAYPPNAYGLYDMAGNCWQWTADFYRPDTYKSHGPLDPLGPMESFDPDEPGLTKYVQRGGSFLCSTDYCVRYRVAGRGKGARDTGASNVSFRCISLK
jgi:formylglycine-generating enzyme required for sulfatase activity